MTNPSLTKKTRKEIFAMFALEESLENSVAYQEIIGIGRLEGEEIGEIRGKEALEMFIEAHRHNNPFAIIYADNNMPMMSGNEMITKVREFENDNNLQPIYAVSTSGDELSGEHNIPFNRFIGKPFKKEEISQALAYVTQNLRRNV
jgi:CheY-like chemotaxis protein